MTRLIICLVGGALLIGGAGLMIARGQESGRILIAGDRPVTVEQVEAKLKADGWSNIVVSRDGRYIEVTGSVNGKTGKIAVDSQTGRVDDGDYDDDDDDDD
jgi:hypothetical protein